MNTRLPPEYAGELFFKADVENMPYPILPPEGAVDLLTKACTMLGQVRFDWAYIDRPKEGSVFVVMLNGDDVPHDGYQYMDDEVTYNFTSETGKRMIIQERQQGFIPGDQLTHVVRRRYKLVNIGKDNVVLLHYTRADDSRKVVVDPRMAKTAPRNYPLKPLPSAAGTPGQPMAYPQQQPGMPGYRPPFPAQPQPQPQVAQQMKSPAGINAAKSGSPYGASPVAPGSPVTAATGQQAGYGRFQAGIPQQIPGQPIQPPPQPTGAPQRLASINGGRKQSHKKQVNPQASLQAQLQHQQLLAQQQEDAEEPSGDELDFLTTRDVAIARYKRNHDYMAEVFSPYPATAIIPNQYDYQQSIEFFKSLQAKHGDDLDEIKNNHDEKIKRFKAEAEVFYRGMLELKQATTVQEVITANERVESFVGVKVLPYSFIRRTELPADEASKTPVMRAKPAPVLPPAHAVTTETGSVSQPVTTEAAVTLPPTASTEIDATSTAMMTDNAITSGAPAPQGSDNTTEAAASQTPVEPTITTPAATAAATESNAMEIDNKQQDRHNNMSDFGSSDMQVDGAPPLAPTFSASEPAPAPAPAPAPVLAPASTPVPVPAPTSSNVDTSVAPSSEPSSVITHDEDHVMAEVPAPVVVVAPSVPAHEGEPAAALDATLAAVSEPTPAATPVHIPTPGPVTSDVASVTPTPVLATAPVEEGEQALSSTQPVPEQKVTEPSLTEFVGQVDSSTNPTTSSEGVSHPTLPAPSGAEAITTPSPLPAMPEVFPTNNVEAAKVPDEAPLPGAADQANLVVDAAPSPTPTSASVPASTPALVATPTPASVEPTQEGAPAMSQEPSPAEAESMPLGSITNLAAAGSGDSVVESGQGQDGGGAAATNDSVAPAAALVKDVAPMVVAAEVSGVQVPAQATEEGFVPSEGQPRAGDPAH